MKTFGKIAWPFTSAYMPNDQYKMVAWSCLNHQEQIDQKGSLKMK